MHQLPELVEISLVQIVYLSCSRCFIIMETTYSGFEECAYKMRHCVSVHCLCVGVFSSKSILSDLSLKYLLCPKVLHFWGFLICHWHVFILVFCQSFQQQTDTWYLLPIKIISSYSVKLSLKLPTKQ